MATQVQIRRGTTAQNDAFTGVEGEVTFNTQNHRLRTHDGITLGGFELVLISDLATKLSLSGGTMSGALDMGGFKITTLGAPTLGGDATTKTYVDAQVSGVTTPPFTDTNSLVKGSADTTKLLRFEVDGFTAATTRILTPQNSDYIIAGTDISNTFSVVQFFPNGSAAAPSLAPSSDTNTGIYFSGADAINFSTVGTNRWTINSSGHLVASTDNTYDIGVSGATRPRDIWAARFITAASAVISGGNVECGVNSHVYWAGRSLMSSVSDGTIIFRNNAATDFNRLQFGGTTSSFPALKRSTTGLQFRLADDSAYTFADALEYRASGTKVVGAQGAAIADASGGAVIDAEARTALNALLARLRTHGLIAT